MNYNELTGPELAFQVAIAMGHCTEEDRPGVFYVDEQQMGIWIERSRTTGWRRVGHWEPHRLWSEGGAIIEKERIAIQFDGWRWVAHMKGVTTRGETPLLAAMRAYVGFKFEYGARSA